MAEAVLAWTLYLSRDMPTYARQQQQRCWNQFPYRSASATRVGILGLGALGSAAARALARVGFKVSGWSCERKDVEGVSTWAGGDGLKHVLSNSDIVVCLLPLTADTTSLLGAEQFSLLPPQACLINFARGKIVVTDDLVAAIDRGQIKHAVLDVFETEPLDPSSSLWVHPGITVLPHISAPTNPQTAAAIVAANVRRYRSCGEIPAGIDFSRGY